MWQNRCFECRPWCHSQVLYSWTTVLVYTFGTFLFCLSYLTERFGNGNVGLRVWDLLPSREIVLACPFRLLYYFTLKLSLFSRSHQDPNDTHVKKVGLIVAVVCIRRVVSNKGFGPYINTTSLTLKSLIALNLSVQQSQEPPGPICT